MPIVVLQGSPYEMGYKYGLQASHFNEVRLVATSHYLDPEMKYPRPYGILYNTIPSSYYRCITAKRILEIIFR